MLWSFKPESFIPHQILGAEDEKNNDDAVNVEITCTDNLSNHHDVLINLRREIPEHFSRFTRVCEVVIQDANVLEHTREHYKFYKQRGYPIAQHKR